MGFLNVEGWLIDLLADRTGNPVASGVPSSGSRFLVVRRLGGVAALKVSDRPLMAVEAYAPFEDDAIAMLNEARQIVLWLSSEVHPDAIVYSVTEVGGPVNLPDPLRPKLARYTASFEMHIRA